MKVQVNGKETETSATTLAALLDELNAPRKGAAVEVNGEIVPAGAAASTALRDHDKIEVIQFVGGG